MDARTGQNVPPGNLNEIREALFDKMETFEIRYTCQQKPFEKLVKFNYESTSNQEENFKKHRQPRGSGNKVPITLPNSSNFAKEAKLF